MPESPDAAIYAIWMGLDCTEPKPLKDYRSVLKISRMVLLGIRLLHAVHATAGICSEKVFVS